MLRLATYNRNAATMPPNSGEITQLAAMLVMVPQLATSQPAAATPAPSTPPTMEWVVDTGAPIQVARFNHRAPASRAAIINQTKVIESPMWAGLITPLLIVQIGRASCRERVCQYV